MGRLNPTPAAATADPPKPAGQSDQPPPSQDEQPIIHFLHAHPLRRTVLPAGYPSPVCTGCEKPCPPTSPVYNCTLCPTLTLDASCFAAPRTTTHRAHPGHRLGLLGTPPYPNRSFRCDACGEDGRAFCYHCTVCTDFDLHVACARAPAKILIPEHGDELEIVFPDTVGSLASLGFRCDVCSGVGVAGTWRYRCEPCDFDAHIGCALEVMEVERSQKEQDLPQSLAAQGLQQQRTTVGVQQQAPPQRPMQHNPYQHQAPWSLGQTQHQHQAPWYSGQNQNQQPVRPPWSSASQNPQQQPHRPQWATSQPQQAPTPAWATSQQQQPEVEDPYEQILNQQREEIEKIAAFFKAYNEMQTRMTMDLLQSYQRPSPLLAGVGGVGGFGAATSPSPLYPYESSGGGIASPSLDALLQVFGNMSLNGTGGSGGFGLGGSAAYPSGIGAGGNDQLNAILSQIMGQQSQGGNFAVPSDLADLLGAAGTGGLDLTSLMSLFFS